jgi:hypothetical protein
MFARQGQANKSKRSIKNRVRKYCTRFGANGKTKGEAKYCTRVGANGKTKGEAKFCTRVGANGKTKREAKYIVM